MSFLLLFYLNLSLVYNKMCFLKSFFSACHSHLFEHVLSMIHSVFHMFCNVDRQNKRSFNWNLSLLSIKLTPDFTCKRSILNPQKSPASTCVQYFGTNLTLNFFTVDSLMSNEVPWQSLYPVNKKNCTIACTTRE